MTVRALIASALFSLCVTAQAEQVTATPTDTFRGETQFHLVKCGLSVRLAILQGVQAGTDSDYPACISAGLASAKPVYGKAAASVKPRAKKEALKSYYAAWISSMQGIAPKSEEARISYEKRTADAEDRLNELWARFEIE